MRRKDREVTELEKVVAIMEECECCRIGLVDGKEAYIVPMNFGYELQGDRIVLYFHCAKEGRKVDLIPKQEVVSFEMDTKRSLVVGEKGCEFSYLYQCVMGKGKMDIVENGDDKISGLKKIMKHYTDREDWEFVPELLDRMCVLRLSVTEWSCKEH